MATSVFALGAEICKNLLYSYQRQVRLLKVGVMFSMTRWVVVNVVDRCCPAIVAFLQKRLLAGFRGTGHESYYHAFSSWQRLRKQAGNLEKALVRKSIFPTVPISAKAIILQYRNIMILLSMRTRHSFSVRGKLLSVKKTDKSTTQSSARYLAQSSTHSSSTSVQLYEYDIVLAQQ